MARSRGNQGGQPRQLSAWEQLARDMADLRAAMLAQTQAARAGGAGPAAVRPGEQAAAALQHAVRAAQAAAQAQPGPVAQAAAQAAARLAAQSARQAAVSPAAGLSPQAQRLAARAQAAQSQAGAAPPPAPPPALPPTLQALQRLQQQARQQQAAAHAAASPAGQAALLQAALARQALSQAQSQAAPPPQTDDFRRAVSRLLEGAQAARAQARAAESPEGQRALRELADAQRRLRQAQGSAGVDGAGPAAVAMERFAHQAVAAAAGLVGFNAAVRAAAMASPNSMATLRESFDLMATKVGSLFVPAVEELARQAQLAAQKLDSIPKPVKEAAGEAGAGAAAGGLSTPEGIRRLATGLFDAGFKSVTGKSVLRANAEERAKGGGFGTTAFGKWALGAVDKLFGKSGPPERSMKGFNTPGFVDFREYSSQITLAGVQSSTLEARQRQEIIENLKKIVDNTANGRPALPEGARPSMPGW